MSEASLDEWPDQWLAEDPLPDDPLPVLKRWLDQAFDDGVQPNPHAVSLATIDPDGRPSVRMVLCNHIDVSRGAFIMYTNLESRKGRALLANPHAAIAFYWGPRNRSARVEGVVELTPAADCDAYFATRPIDAQVGAWASAQSEPIASRAAMLSKVEAQAKRFGVELDGPGGGGIPRPPHWGGFTLVAERVELWVSRPARIHDRAEWRREHSERGEPLPWSVTRLQP
jgi:pyridoxamine 5'-phosphate oxidase